MLAYCRYYVKNELVVSVYVLAKSEFKNSNVGGKHSAGFEISMTLVQVAQYIEWKYSCIIFFFYTDFSRSKDKKKADNSKNSSKTCPK